jgi:hypothetical protein
MNNRCQAPVIHTRLVSRWYDQPARTTSTAVHAAMTTQPRVPQPLPPIETWLACTS